MVTEKFSYLERGFIRIKGKDSISFLNSIITNDVKKVTQSNGIYALLLNPQGKYLYDMFITQVANQDYRIEIEAGEAQVLIEKLKLYKLRSEVIIEKEEDLKVIGVWGPNILNIYQLKCGEVKLDKEMIILADPRFHKLGVRIYYKNNLIWPFILGDYNDYRIKLGIPEGKQDLIKEKSFPLHFGLHVLNAIDFEKGCYIGQEVISRTKYRGVIRKNIFILTSEKELMSGQEILYNSVDKIRILSVSTTNAIALVDIEENTHLDQELLLNQENKITIIKPEWQD